MRPSPYVVIPQRTTQPYRVGQQHPGMALAAMQRGRTLYGQNPMDLRRQVQANPGSLLALLLDLSAGRPTIPRPTP